MTKFIDRKHILMYEIHSSRFANKISWNWLQDIVGRYFAWKVRTKYNRYIVSLIEREKAAISE